MHEAEVFGFCLVPLLPQSRFLQATSFYSQLRSLFFLAVLPGIDSTVKAVLAMLKHYKI
jgi:hypothetical protein